MQFIASMAVIAGTTAYFYYDGQEARPQADPNGLSTFAIPAYKNLTALGIETKIYPDHAAILDEQSDYARFKRVYSFTQKYLKGVYTLPQSVMKPEFIERIEIENGYRTMSHIKAYNDGAD